MNKATNMHLKNLERPVGSGGGRDDAQIWWQLITLPIAQVRSPSLKTEASVIFKSNSYIPLQKLTFFFFLKATAFCSGHRNRPAKRAEILWNFHLNLKADMNVHTDMHWHFWQKAQLCLSWQRLSWESLKDRTKRYVLLPWSSLRWAI